MPLVRFVRAAKEGVFDRDGEKELEIKEHGIIQTARTASSTHTGAYFQLP